jgi:hypothetical protein
MGMKKPIAHSLRKGRTWCTSVDFQRPRPMSGEERPAKNRQVAFRIRRSETAIFAAIQASACLDERDMHAPQEPVNRLAIGVVKAAVDDCAIRTVAHEDQQHVLGKYDRTDHLSSELLDRPIERGGQQELTFDNEQLLAREFSAGRDHYFASTMEVRVSLACWMQGHARILFRQVSALRDCDIFRNRTSHARAARRSAATVPSEAGLDPVAFIAGIAVTPTTSASKTRNFFT